MTNMATFFEVDRVKYLCSCGYKQAFCNLYLCRHCLLLRCQECVLHEVDNHYCPNCLEILPLSEAKIKKNRCSNCVDCPSCGHTLATRATSIQFVNPDDPNKTTPKKMYYMACGFCRWTTRDGGILDQPTASGCWSEQENDHIPRIKAVLEYYHKLACKEQMNLDIKKYSQKRKHRLYSDKYFTALSALPGKDFAGRIDEDRNVSAIEAAKTVVEFAPLSDDYFTEDMQPETVTRLEQRLRSPVVQADSVATMYPVNKHLLIRKSFRCKECEHNISKPDYNPMSIKFKILMAAINHVPEVRMMNSCLLEPHKECSVVLTLTNPAIFNTVVKLVPMKDDDSCQVQLPECEFVLCHCDHTASVTSDSKQQTAFKDDRSVVVFRNANKLGVMLKVTPLVDVGPVTMNLSLQHEYRNTTVSVTSDENEVEVRWLQHDVFIRLGDIA